MRIPDSALRLGGVVVRPAGDALGLARRAERGTRRRLIDGSGRATLACVDAALASPYADQAVQRVIDSDLAERAVARALSGDLVDVVAGGLVRHKNGERVGGKAFVGGAVGP